MLGKVSRRLKPKGRMISKRKSKPKSKAQEFKDDEMNELLVNHGISDATLQQQEMLTEQLDDASQHTQLAEARCGRVGCTLHMPGQGQERTTASCFQSRSHEVWHRRRAPHALRGDRISTTRRVYL